MSSPATPQQALPLSAPRPLDAGGIRRVDTLRAQLATHEARACVWRPLLEDQRRPGPSPLELASLELAAEAPPESNLRVELEWDGSVQRARIHFGEAVSLYGGGSAPGPLARAGKTVRLWARVGTADEPHSEAPHVHPLALGVRLDGSALAVLGDSLRAGLLRFGQDHVELAFEGEPWDLWVIEAPSPQALSGALAELLGRIELPPSWSFGNHHTVLAAASAAAVSERAAKLRSRHLPYDVLALDSASLDRGRPFTWSKDGFENPARTLDELHEQGFRVLAPLEPFLPAGKHYPAHKSGIGGEHFVVDSRGQPLRVRAEHGPSSYPDFTQDSTRAWWSALVEKHAECGIDGYWSETNLPTLPLSPTGTLPSDAAHRGLGAHAHSRAHNASAHLWSQATRDGLAQARPTQRPFALSRGGHAASARHGATWVVAQQANWEELRGLLARVLSLGLSGQPLAGIEIGARSGTLAGELLARWHELAALMPLSRDDGREPFGHGQDVDRAIKAALERRMRLVPTFASLAAEAHAKGLPLVRPMFFSDPSDRALRDVDDQFLLGDDIVAAPVLQPGATQRTVLLPSSPSGGWYLLEGGRDLLPPGRYTVEAPLGRTPLFVRAGRIVVTKPSKANVRVQREEDPELHVFFDPRQRATGALHEDDGETRADRGITTEFSARVARGRVVIDAFANGREVVDRAWHVHAHGATLQKP
jgi:alpha-glucosidase